MNYKPAYNVYWPGERGQYEHSSTFVIEIFKTSWNFPQNLRLHLLLSILIFFYTIEMLSEFLKNSVHFLEESHFSKEIVERRHGEPIEFLFLTKMDLLGSQASTEKSGCEFWATF